MVDELDKIAPMIEYTNKFKFLATALFSTMMYTEYPNVFVIAIESCHSVRVDPYLRNRFGVPIKIDIPNEDDRLDMLRIYTKGMCLAEDVDLEKIAAKTNEYVGDDLKCMCDLISAGAEDGQQITMKDFPNEIASSSDSSPNKSPFKSQHYANPSRTGCMAWLDAACTQCEKAFNFFRLVLNKIATAHKNKIKN